MSQVDAYHRTWRAYFTPLILTRTPVLDYAALPRFAFQEEPTGAVSGRVGWSLLGMAAPALAIGWLALRRLTRFPVVM